MPPTDLEHIQRIMAGDWEAFSAVYQLHGPPVFRFALHMTGERQAAEDATQETFMKLIRHPGDYDPSRAPLLAWLLGIARNVLRRRSGAEMETPLDDEVEIVDEATEGGVLADLTRRELVDVVRQAVHSLPPVYREVVILCELQELDYREAATVLNCPIGTVRSRLNRARALLLTKLDSRCLA